MHELQCQPGPAGFVGTICVAMAYTILHKEMRMNCFHVRNLKGKHFYSAEISPEAGAISSRFSVAESIATRMKLK